MVRVRIGELNIEMERIVRGKYPDGALPLFIGGGNHVVVRGCNLTSEKKFFRKRLYDAVL